MSKHLTYNQASQLYARTYERLRKLFPHEIQTNRYSLYQDRYTGYGFYHKWYFTLQGALIASLSFEGWDKLVEKKPITWVGPELQVARQYTVTIQRLIPKSKK